MRIFKKVLPKAAAALAAVLLMEFFIGNLLEPVTYEHFLNIDRRKMKEQGIETNLVFLGDSRCLRTFISSVFEEVLPEVEGALNLGVNQQDLASSYVYAKDLLENHEIKYLVLSVNSDYLLQGTVIDTIVKNLTVERMESLENKIAYVKMQFTPREYPTLLKSYRYRDYIGDIGKNWSQKLQKEYWQGIDTREDLYYVEKGHIGWDIYSENGNAGIPAGCRDFEEENIDWNSVSYLDKLAQLCRENGTKLILVEAPISLGRMYKIENYEGFHELMMKKSEELQIPFYNLNMVKQREEMFSDENFTDSEHLNEAGARHASELLANLLLKESSGEDKDIFYKSLEELNAEIGKAAGCDFYIYEPGISKLGEESNVFGEDYYVPYLEKIKEGHLLIAAESVAPKGMPVEYQFSISLNGGKSYEVLQEYSPADTFLTQSGQWPEDALLQVKAREAGNHLVEPAFMRKAVSGSVRQEW